MATIREVKFIEASNTDELTTLLNAAYVDVYSLTDGTVTNILYQLAVTPPKNRFYSVLLSYSYTEPDVPPET